MVDLRSRSPPFHAFLFSPLLRYFSFHVRVRRKSNFRQGKAFFEVELVSWNTHKHFGIEGEEENGCAIHIRWKMVIFILWSCTGFSFLFGGKWKMLCMCLGDFLYRSSFCEKLMAFYLYQHEHLQSFTLMSFDTSSPFAEKIQRY